MIDQLIHRDTFLEQQQTEKIETEVRDVDRIRITCTLASRGVIRVLQSDIKICPPPPPHPAFSSLLINEDLLGQAAAGLLSITEELKAGGNSICLCLTGALL
jgi:hypothetical protein